MNIRIGIYLIHQYQILRILSRISISNIIRSSFNLRVHISIRISTNISINIGISTVLVLVVGSYSNIVQEYMQIIWVYSHRNTKTTPASSEHRLVQEGSILYE